MAPQGKAARYLEFLQARAIERFGEDKPPSTFNEQYARRVAESMIPENQPRRDSMIANMIEAQRRQFEDLLTQLPSPHENAYDYGLMLDLAKTIERLAGAGAAAGSLPPFPTFGTLRTGQVNAMAVRVPESDEFLVLFEDGLFGFANLMAKAVATMFPVTVLESGGWTFSTDEKHWRQGLAKDPAPIERITEALVAYLVLGHPHKARPYLVAPAYSALTGPLRGSMELFVMAHEWGHIVSGDLSTGQVAETALGAEAGEVVRLNYEQEFRADTIGAGLTISAQLEAGFDIALCFCGIDLFFSCIDLVEKSVSVLVCGEVRPMNSDTHPPTLLRRQFMRDALERSVDADAAKGAVQLAKICETFVSLSFDTAIQPMLREHFKRGTKLAPGWTA